MIYTGKGFSVECLAEQPNDKNIIYTGNSENDYLKLPESPAPPPANHSGQTGSGQSPVASVPPG